MCLPLLPKLSATLSCLLALPAAHAADRDHARSVEAGATCVAAGEARDAERLRRCCKSNVPTQARQADWDRYTQVCLDAAGKSAAAPAGSPETGVRDERPRGEGG